MLFPSAKLRFVRALVRLNRWLADYRSGTALLSGFQAAREAANRERWAAGSHTWNSWARDMRALRATGGDHADTEPLFSAAATVAFVGSDWPAAADASGFIFPGRCSFRRARFQTEAWFSGAEFDAACDFTDCDFGPGGAWFERVRMRGAAHFAQSRWRGAAEWRGGVLEQGGDFDGAQFDKDCWFAGTRFMGPARFVKAEFSAEAGFGSSVFAAEAHFDGCHFARNAGFEGCAFRGRTVFDDARFEAKAWFRRAHFDGPTSFDRARFTHLHNLDFTDAVLAPRPTATELQLDEVRRRFAL